MIEPARSDVVELVDSHAHLGFDEYAGDLDAVLDRARRAGVTGIVTIGSGGGPDVFRRAFEPGEGRDGVSATVGIHPHDARHATESLLGELAELARSPRVAAVGETGLDYHYGFSPREDQLGAFRAQLELARAVGKPVVIHTREAEQDTLAVLRELGGTSFDGVVHCFSGDRAFAERVVELGLHVSFSGIVAFPSAVAVQQAARHVPSERLLVETDSPFLSPPPHRGRRNEPARVRLVAEKVAELRGLTLAELGRITTGNARRLFGLEGELGVPLRVLEQDVVGI